MRPEADVRAARWTAIWRAMDACVEARLRARGHLARRPQGRAARAESLHRRAQGRDRGAADPLVIWTGSTCSRSRSTRRTPRAAAWSPRRPTAPPASSPPCSLLPALSAQRRRRRHAALLAHAPPRSACSTRKTPRSAAPRSAVRARSASRARWRRARWPRSWAAHRRRSRTPRRSAWSTTSA